MVGWLGGWLTVHKHAHDKLKSVNYETNEKHFICSVQFYNFGRNFKEEKIEEIRVKSQVNCFKGASQRVFIVVSLQ